MHDATSHALPPNAVGHFDAAALSQDILKGGCVLLLGPDLLLCDGQPVNDTLKSHLWTQHRRHIAHFFEREGLFKFQTDAAKKRVQTDAIPQFFNAARADEEVLKKLLAIPFHLVVQVTSDTFLSDAAHRYSVAHQFKFFAGNGKTAEPVDAPTAAMPLFYNLCGTKDRPGSMLLDFDDLYNYLKAIFEPPGLPENLRTALTNDSISTFLFLGFQLDRWYTQLLIRWLSDVAGAERFANHFAWQPHNRDIGEFVEQHLSVIPTGTRTALELLDDIHRAIPADRLRPLTDPASPNTVAIRRAVQNGDLEKALLLFDQVAASIGEKDAATMLLSQFNELKTAHSQYFLSKEQFWEKCQNLKFRLLDLIKKHTQTL